MRLKKKNERKPKQNKGRLKAARKRVKERNRLVSLFSRLCGMTRLCTAAVFVNQGQGLLLDNFSGRKEGRRGTRGRERRVKSEGEKKEG